MRIEGPQWGVPQEVEQTIRRQAQVIAEWVKEPDVVWDLAQEGRLAAWKKAALDTQVSHLLFRSRQAMIKYASLGRSVDGKLMRTHNRVVVHDVLQLDGPAGDGENTLGDVLVDDRFPAAKFVASIMGIITQAATNHISYRIAPNEDDFPFRSVVRHRI